MNQQQENFEVFTSDADGQCDIIDEELTLEGAESVALHCSRFVAGTVMVSADDNTLVSCYVDGVSVHTDNKIVPCK